MRRLALLFALVLAIVVAGCGGGGGGGDRLSKDEYVAQADAICKEVEQKGDAIEEPTSLEDVGRFVDEALPVFDDGLDRLRELRPPAELQDAVDDWLATGNETRDLLEELKDAAGDGDAAKVQELGGKGEDLDKKSDDLARQIGLEECAND